MQKSAKSQSGVGFKGPNESHTKHHGLWRSRVMMSARTIAFDKQLPITEFDSGNTKLEQRVAHKVTDATPEVTSDGKSCKS